MDLIKQFFHSYSTSLEILPEGIRLVAAIAILIVLAIIFLRFIQKSIIWLIIFVLLLPAAWPALREIGLTFWEKVLVPFLQ